MDDKIYQKIFRCPLTSFGASDAKLPQNIRLFTYNSNICLSTDILKLWSQSASEVTYLVPGKPQLSVIVQMHQGRSGTSLLLYCSWLDSPRLTAGSNEL